MFDMFKVDNVRGLAYRGKNGYIIELEDSKLYILHKDKKIHLTNLNSVLLKEKKLCKKL